VKSRVLDELLQGTPHPLTARLESWFTARRFAGFVSAHLPKVRKKLRGARDPEAARDLLLELDAAYRLLQDKRLTVAYEPTPGGSSRGPDFAVRYTTRLEVMVEVTRTRRQAGPPASHGGAAKAPFGSVATLDAHRLAGVLFLKLGQTLIDRANVLVIGTEGAPPSNGELAEHLKAARMGAESEAPSALARQGFKSRGDYLRRFASLSAVVVRRAPTLADDGLEPDAAIWSNESARAPLSNDVRAAVIGALAGHDRH